MPNNHAMCACDVAQRSSFAVNIILVRRYIYRPLRRLVFEFGALRSRVRSSWLACFLVNLGREAIFSAILTLRQAIASLMIGASSAISLTGRLAGVFTIVSGSMPSR